ncbi:protein of unknown function [Streptomyces murinus]
MSPSTATALRPATPQPSSLGYARRIAPWRPNHIRIGHAVPPSGASSTCCQRGAAEPHSRIGRDLPCDGASEQVSLRASAARRSTDRACDVLATPAWIRRSDALLHRLQNRHALHMMRHRKQIERPQHPHPIPVLPEVPQIPRQRRRIARHVRDAPGPQGREVLHRVAAGARAGWVEDDQVDLGDARAREDGFDLALFDADAGEVGQVVAGVLDGAFAGLDAEDRTLVAQAVGEGAGEEADAAVEVEGHLALARQQALHHRGDEGVRRLRVDLPEAAGADPVGAAVRALADEGAAVHAVHAPGLLVDPHDRDRLVQLDQGQAAARTRSEDHLAVLGTRRRDRLDRLHAGPLVLLDAQLRHAGRRDHAVVDALDLVRAVPAQTCVALGIDRVLHPGAPLRHLAGGQLVALGRDHRAVPAGLLGREAREPPQLLGEHVRLQPALGARLGVLPVAATAAAGPGEGAGRLDAVLGRLQDAYGVRAQEAGALLALGHLRHHPLARQRVPDEEDLALGGTGDAVAAVGDGADLDLVLLAHQRRGRFCLHGGWLQRIGFATRTAKKADELRRRVRGGRAQPGGPTTAHQSTASPPRSRTPVPRQSFADDPDDPDGSDGSDDPDGSGASLGRSPAGPRRTAPGALHSWRLRARILAASEEASW